MGLSRNRFPYEKSSEFKRKKAAGQPAYPAAAPWYPATGGLSSEMLASALAGYPYRAKVWFNHMSNPVYGIAGFRQALADKLGSARVAAGRLDQSLHQRDQRAGRLHRAGHRDL